MVPQAPGAIHSPDLKALLDGHHSMRSSGQLSWKITGAVAVGELSVECQSAVVDGPRLRVHLKRERLSSPGFQLLGNGVALFRVDVNGKHDGWDLCTHKHVYVPADGRETAERMGLADFPAVPMRPGVPAGAIREMFERFASMSKVDLVGDYWSDPGKGWRI